MSCSCCKLEFRIYDNNGRKKCLPYLLPCNHPACEKCLNKIVQDLFPIKCTICNKACSISAESQKPIHYAFPVDFNLIGRMIYNSISEDRQSYILVQKYDVQSGTNLISNIEPKKTYVKGKCFECNKLPSCICIQCKKKMCDRCFSNIHNSKTFRNHYKANLALRSYILMSHNCSEHKGKDVDFYCQTCEKYICSECVFLCKQHDFISLSQKSSNYYEHLSKEKRNIEKVLAFLRKMKNDYENNKPSSQLTNEVEKSIEMAHAALRWTEIDYIQNVERNIRNKIDAEIMAICKDELKLINLLNIVQICCDNNNKEKLESNLINMQMIESEITNMYEMSWSWPKNISNNKLTVNTDLLNDIQNKFCKLDIEEKFEYEIITPSTIISNNTCLTKKKANNESFESNDSKFDVDVKTDVHYLTNRLSRCSNGDVIKSNNKNFKVESLKIGLAHGISIVHINHPNDFYIQCHQNTKLLDEHSNYFCSADGCSVSKDSLIKGNILVHRNEDNATYRVTVMENSNNDFTIKVKFIDYGFSKEVPLSSLYLLEEMYKSLPALAYNCVLNNFITPTNGWTDDNIKLMKDSISSSSYTINIVKLHDDHAEVKLSIDYDFYSIDFNDILLFHNNIRILDISKFEMSGMKISENKYKPPKLLSFEEEVIVTCVMAPNEFYVRKVSSEESFNKIARSLQYFYKSNQRMYMIYLPMLDICVACFVDDLNWCRGYITKIENKNSISVFLVDYGSTKVVPLTSLRYLYAKFRYYRPFAILCTLHGIKPIGDNWSDEATQCLVDYTNNWNPLRIKLISPGNDKSFLSISNVILFNNKDPHSINEELVMKLFATKIVLNVEEKSIEKKSDTTDKKCANVSSKKRNSDKIPVRVLSVTSPSEIYISLVSEEETEKLSYDMGIYFLKVNPKLKSNAKWKIHDRCAVFSEITYQWYKGEIRGIIENENKYEIFMNDIAKTEVLHFENLRELPDIFAQIADASIKCCITGIIPALGNQWSKSTCEYLLNIFETYPTFYIHEDTSLSHSNDDSVLPVKLWVEHHNMDAPLEPTVIEWKSVSEMIVLKGLAIRDNNETEEMECLIQEIKENCDSEKKSDSQVSEDKIETIDMTPSENEVLDIKYSLIKKWEPPILPQKEFIGIPTYVDDDFYIYVIDVANEKVLCGLNGRIQKAYKNLEPQAHDMFWSTDQPCIAQWEFDSNFYRAITKKIIDDRNIEVQFIDYGNDEICSIKSLRKSVIMEDVPTLAWKCKIVGVTLKDSENVIDFVHSTIVEKQCNITVLGKSVENVIYIRLHLSKLGDFAEYLVLNNYADYCDLPDMAESMDAENEQNVENESSDADIVVDVLYDIGSENSFSLIENSENNCLAFSKWRFNDVPIKCTVVDIFSSNRVLLKISSEALSTVWEKIESTFEDIRAKWQDQPLFEKNDERKCCIAFVDEGWHRGEIYQTIKPSNNSRDRDILYKINFVDLGYIKTVPNGFVREARPEWLKFPPLTIEVSLFGISLSDEFIFDDILSDLKQLYAGEVYVKVLSENDEDYNVEIFGNVNDTTPIYQELIDKGFLNKFGVS